MAKEWLKKWAYLIIFKHLKHEPPSIIRQSRLWKW